ncbi:hypothetical protein [Micromonospora sp. DT47]|uniref:hypothetical protein n=1 Tax=Micromonospora sp. DT47 TaxID=3393431 RepID=UPI003CE8066E
MLHGVAAAVTVLVLAPLARPGYVLSYDMVFVPRQALDWELIAPAQALPRAVPQDAVVALATQVAPGWLVQRLVLAVIIYAAAVGAGRLVPTRRLSVRVVAAVGYAWTPYLAERLLLGQWGLLLAYAALPWLVSAALGVHAGRPGALPRLLLAAAAAAITPTGGVIALVVAAALLPGRYVNAARSSAVGLIAIAAFNAPWLVAALLTAAGGRSDAAGVVAFAARAENWGGSLVALLGTGGIWNSQTTPASRSSPLVPLVTAALLVIAAVGAVELWRRWPAGVAARLGLLAVGGLAVAATGVLPGGADGLAFLVRQVPGAGLVRDGHKFLIPYALVLALGFALGAERLADRLTPRLGGVAARVLVVVLALLPVALLPDLAFGGAGRLRPVSYPADWDAVARHVADRPGEVLSLPFHEYQSYRWNADRVVIDPAPRYLPAPVLTDDTLRVGDLVVAGENPRAARVRELLAAGSSVAGTGVRWVLVRHEPNLPVTPQTLAGLQRVHSGEHLSLYENPGWSPDRRQGPLWPVAAAHLLAAAAVVAAVVAAASRVLHRTPDP